MSWLAVWSIGSRVARSSPLTTPQLKYDQVRNEISSDSSFQLTGQGQSVAGVGFVSDPNMNNIRINKTIKGSGGAVTIPGQ